MSVSHRPYPNRDRSLRQLERSRVCPEPRRQPTLPELIVHLNSEQHTEVMRRVLPTAAQFISRFRAATMGVRA